MNFDAFAAIRCTASAHSTYEVAVARKNRSPNGVERYLWTPLSASAGEADGRTYLGKLDLDPETSHQIACTGAWHDAKRQFKLTAFYNRISDYIQGSPIARVVAAKPVLQYQNFDPVDLFGLDAQAAWQIDKHFRMRGSLSYVRGKNHDSDDNLYRIAPLRGTLGLDYLAGAWESSVELDLADAQNDVAAYNHEARSAGYALVHLRAGYTFSNHIKVRAGIENLCNQSYSDHLGGINRVARSAVPVGTRIPGAGRFFYLACSRDF